MKYTEHLLKIAERFAHKLLLAQQASAQPGEIMAVLQTAGLWEKSAEVAPLLNTAGVSDDTTVQIFIIVDSKLNCTYRIATTPPRPAAAIKLRGLLNYKYSVAMKKALTTANISVTDTIELKWMNF